MVCNRFPGGIQKISCDQEIQDNLSSSDGAFFEVVVPKNASVLLDTCLSDADTVMTLYEESMCPGVMQIPRKFGSNDDDDTGFCESLGDELSTPSVINTPLDAGSYV
jgi:hypothetical protein